MKYLARLLLLFTLLSTPLLATGNWGRSGTRECALGVWWDTVFCDVAGISYKAQMPGYTVARFQVTGCPVGTVTLKGQVRPNSFYLISAPLVQFRLFENYQHFVKTIKKDNPNFTISEMETTKENVTYCAELTPKKKPRKGEIWRFYLVNQYIVQMATNDENEVRRTKFFDSISFKGIEFTEAKSSP